MSVFPTESYCLIIHPMKIANLISLIMTILLFLCGCSTNGNKKILENISIDNSGQNYDTHNKRQYPEWFWNMPYSDNELFAVGYSETSKFRPENSEKNAINDGLVSLAKFFSVHIKSEIISINNILESNTEEEIDPKVEFYVNNNYTVVAKFISPEYTYVLLKLGDKNDSEPEVSVGSEIIPPKPYWLSKLPSEPGYIYATGESIVYYREIESWREAEKRARVALAYNIETQIKGLIRKVDDRIEDNSIVSIANQTLSNVQVISRWKDTKLNSCHVLLRMPLVR